MARFTTHECRWFFEGEPSEEVVRWFQDSRPWDRLEPIEEPGWPETWREDRYWVLQGQSEVGIKWRDETGSTGPRLFEIKGRTAELGEVRLTPSVTGRFDEWVKWSVPMTALGETPTGMAGSSVTVSKKRLLRRVRLERGTPLVELPLEGPDAWPSRGMATELTRVRRRGDAFWTFGLEAFPTDPEIHADVVGHMTGFLETYPGRLKAEHSLSYAAWLGTGS
jgi:hypothetical protein